MGNELTLDLAHLDSGLRLRVLGGPLLDRAPDPELQQLVEEAAQVTGFPIALVSLVVSRIQFFRAQVGLPPDLEAARSTDRCNSFCQYVVSGNRPLEVSDATQEAGLPQELVRRYGIRAYLGYPLRLLGQTVGTLCVLDLEPRKASAADRDALAQLAKRAVARLERMAVQWAVPVEPPSLAELKAHGARIDAFERQQVMSLSEQFAVGRLSADEFQRALGALATLTGTLGLRQ
jgi:hypothetical protein